MLIEKNQLEISNLIDRYNSLDDMDMKTEVETKLIKIIESNICNIIPIEFLTKIDKEFYSKWRFTKFKSHWEIYVKINQYIHASKEEKNCLINEIENLMQKKREKILGEKNFVKAIYLSNIPEIISLYEKQFCKPPFSIFDSDSIPECLMKSADEKNHIVNDFKKLNKQDYSIENKIMYIQRHIRARVRKESEIKRISNMYTDCHIFRRASKGMERDKFIEMMIEDASKPYRPKKCSLELAERIVKAADQVTLHSTVKHITATQHIANIIDECIYGRENLRTMFKEFRPSALCPCDVRDGDGNVICFGPDKIDPNCIKYRSIALEFDLNKLLKSNGLNKNPNMFVKQLDFGFALNLEQKINLKTELITINHTPLDGSVESGYKRLYLHHNGEHYYSDLPKYSLISYNTNDIQKIWALNFFRFLDKLKFRKEIDCIYDLISKLTDQELIEFLTDLGKKMSCTSEFNFYGAYKIDLNAITSIALYKELTLEDDFSVSISKLEEELNKGSFDTLIKLIKFAPELFKSTRFVDFIISKILDPIKIAHIEELIKGSANT